MFKFHQLYYITTKFLCHHRNFFTCFIGSASALDPLKLAKSKGGYVIFFLFVLSFFVASAVAN